MGREAEPQTPWRPAAVSLPSQEPAGPEGLPPGSLSLATPTPGGGALPPDQGGTEQPHFRATPGPREPGAVGRLGLGPPPRGTGGRHHPGADRGDAMKLESQAMALPCRGATGVGGWHPPVLLQAEGAYHLCPGRTAHWVPTAPAHKLRVGGKQAPGGPVPGPPRQPRSSHRGCSQDPGRSQGPPGRNRGMSQAGGPSRRGLTLRVLEAGTTLAPPHPTLRAHHSVCNSTLFRAPRVCPHRHRPDIGRGATGPAHPLLTGKGQNTAPPLGPLCFHNKGHPPAPVTGPACRLLPSPKPSEAHHTPTWKPSPRMSPCPSPSCADGPPGGHPLL